MGKRKPPEHSLESRANGRLTYILSEWVVNKHDQDDYGIDFSVKPTNDTGEQLPLEIDIQLKASQNYDGESTVTQRLDTDALSDYMRSRKPVFLMVYDDSRNEIYWRLIQEYIWEEYGRSPSSWEDQETVTIRLNRQPLSGSIEEVIQTGSDAEEPIFRYLIEESLMSFMYDMVSRNELEKALYQGVSESIELCGSHVGTDASKIAVGIANSGGGTMVFGVGKQVTSNRPRVRGIDNPELAVSSIENQLDNIEPHLDAELRLETLDDLSVAVVDIPPYSEIPHADNGTFYIREGRETRPMHPEEVKSRIT